MTNPPPPHKPFTISRLLMGSLMTGAMICGVIGGLGVLFFADGFFDIGPDPAIPTTEIKTELNERMAQVDRRILRLEEQTDEKSAGNGADPSQLAALQKNIAQNSEETKRLEQQVQSLSTTKQEENKAAQIALGLTQIKTAYENDLSMQTGLQTLKNAVNNASMQKTLDELSALTAQNFPTKKELLGDIDAMKKSLNAPVPPIDPKAMTWDQRAKYEFGKFVSVQPTQTVQQRTALTRIEDMIRANNFEGALNTIRQFPETTQQKIFYKKLEMRVRAEMMVHQIITDVTQKIGLGGKGSLY